MNTYVTGEQVEVEATLAANGVAIDVSALTVTAVLVSRDRRNLISSRVTCTKPGGTGKVLATWPASESIGWTLGRYLVQFWVSGAPYCHESPEIDIIQGWST